MGSDPNVTLKILFLLWNLKTMPSHTNDEFQFLHPSNEKTGEEASPDHDEN